MKQAWLLVLLFVGVAACNDPTGVVTVEALVTKDDGTFGLADVELTTLEDLHTGAGSRFDVRGAVVIELSQVNEAIIGGQSFADMNELSRRQSQQPVAPRMRKDGDRYIADDYETLYYFTLFANMERAFLFADGLGDTSGATQAEALVAMFPRLNASALLPLPVLSSDNAAYVAPYDGWVALPAVIQAGVPFGMSEAVMAHEYGHRFFFHNVWRPDQNDDRLSTWSSVLQGEGGGGERSQRLLSGVDEGLADVFAMATLRDADAVRNAFAAAAEGFGDDNPFALEAERRSMGGAFATSATYDNLSDLSLDASLLQSCGITTANFDGAYTFYCVGTVVAATLWASAGEDAGVLADEWMPVVLAALPNVGASLVNTSGDFDVDVLVEALAAAAPPGRMRDGFCEQARVRFASFVSSGRVPSCL